MRNMKKLLFVPALLAAVSILLAACGPTEIPDSKNWDVENFSYTDQDGKPFSKGDLKGKVWLADFIFTNCETVCPPMTYNMTKLQSKLKAEGIKDVEIVSFSVDPKVDTPDALKQFGNKFKADFSNWHFLTGYDQDEIDQLARMSFKTVAQKPENQDQVIHGTSFYLIDEDGQVKQTYAGNKDVPFEDIIKHIKILQKN
jgi:protein SCO1